MRKIWVPASFTNYWQGSIENSVPARAFESAHYPAVGVASKAPRNGTRLFVLPTDRCQQCQWPNAQWRQWQRGRDLGWGGRTVSDGAIPDTTPAEIVHEGKADHDQQCRGVAIPTIGWKQGEGEVSMAGNQCWINFCTRCSRQGWSPGRFQARAYWI